MSADAAQQGHGLLEISPGRSFQQVFPQMNIAETEPEELKRLDSIVRKRIEELQARINEVGMSGLGDAEKAELRELHAAPR